MARWGVAGTFAGALVAVAWRYVPVPSFGAHAERATESMYDGTYEPLLPTFGQGWVAYSNPRTSVEWSACTFGSVIAGALLFGLVGALVHRRGLVIARKGGGRSVTALFGSLGLLVGLLTCALILALPPELPPEGAFERFGQALVNIKLVDTDLVWWLVPVVCAGLGVAIGLLTHRAGWRLCEGKVVVRRIEKWAAAAMLLILVAGLVSASSGVRPAEQCRWMTYTPRPLTGAEAYVSSLMISLFGDEDVPPSEMRGVCESGWTSPE